MFLDTWLPFFLAEARHAAAFLLLYAPAPVTEKAAPAPVQPPSPTVTSPQQPGSARAAAARAAAEAAAAKAAEVGCTSLKAAIEEVALHVHKELYCCSLRNAHARGGAALWPRPLPGLAGGKSSLPQAAPPQHSRTSLAPLLYRTPSA